MQESPKNKPGPSGVTEPGKKEAHTGEALKAKGYKFRDQRRRYPWWVKSVERMTTETDDTIARQPGLPIVAEVWFFKGREEYQALVAKGQAKARENIINKVPGCRIQDLSLIFASGTYFPGGYTWDGNYYDGIEKVSKIVSVQVHPPDKLGVPRWEGTDAEASEMVEAAAIHLGALQVGYAAVNPLWLSTMARFDPVAEKIKTTAEGLTIIPERFKYVVVMAVPVPQAAARRATSFIGGAANRVGFEGYIAVRERVKNFIRGIGYGVMELPINDNAIPFAVMAGLGEMGRMNRMISPIYGGALCVSALITDLPLALDKPIDFGLQEFCKRCKICARVCPASAISREDDPSWTPGDEYGVPGKKVWFEYGSRCHTYCVQAAHFCGACMYSCCWTKENTWFHNLMRVIGSNMPLASGLMAHFEKAFRFGIVPPEKREDWWKMKLPNRGINSFNVRRAM